MKIAVVGSRCAEGEIVSRILRELPPAYRRSSAAGRKEWIPLRKKRRTFWVSQRRSFGRIMTPMAGARLWCATEILSVMPMKCWLSGTVNPPAHSKR